MSNTPLTRALDEEGRSCCVQETAQLTLLLCWCAPEPEITELRLINQTGKFGNQTSSRLLQLKSRVLSSVSLKVADEMSSDFMSLWARFSDCNWFVNKNRARKKDGNPASACPGRIKRNPIIWKALNLQRRQLLDLIRDRGNVVSLEGQVFELSGAQNATGNLVRRNGIASQPAQVCQLRHRHAGELALLKRTTVMKTQATNKGIFLFEILNFGRYFGWADRAVGAGDVNAADKLQNIAHCARGPCSAAVTKEREKGRAERNEGTRKRGENWRRGKLRKRKENEENGSGRWDTSAVKKAAPRKGWNGHVGLGVELPPATR